MSYLEAKEFFAGNDQHVNRNDQPFLYNLNSGLLQLSDALEGDMLRIQNSIFQFETRLQHLEQK